MDRAAVNAEFPFAEIVYASVDPAFLVKLTAFGANIPHNIKDSSIPGADFIFCFSNPESRPLSLRLYLSWEHLSGCGALGDGKTWSDRTGNGIKPVWKKENVGLFFYPGRGAAAPCNAVGEYALMVKKSKRVRTNMFWWNVLEGQEGFLKAVNENAAGNSTGEVLSGRFEAMPKGCEGSFHPAGVLSLETTLLPGEQLALPAALAWYMPHHFTGADSGMDEEMQRRRGTG